MLASTLDLASRYDYKFKQMVFLFLVQFVQDISMMFGRMISGIVRCGLIANPKKRQVYKRRVVFFRKSFHEFASQLTAVTFRRMFRMERGAFDLLCDKFRSHVGIDQFHPQSSLHSVSRQRDMCNAHLVGSGGFISGETNVAIFIRFIAGGSNYDIAGCYGIYHSSVYRIIDTVLCWIHDMPFGMVCMEKYLSTKDCVESRLRESVKAGFAKRANGVMDGCIGVLDGWTPKVLGNGTTSLFTRKGYHAINVQLVGDHLKRILWLSDKFTGSTHDSPAFQKTSLYNLLLEKYPELYERLEYILADSAYSVRSFLQVPFPRTLPDTDQDNFNCYLSKLRIFSECVIGEMCKRWGIFQHRMGFHLQKAREIIRACAKMHNFLVDYRTEHGENSETLYVSFNEIETTVIKDLNPDPKKRGRPTDDEQRITDLGTQLRRDIATRIKNAGLVRPSDSRKRRRTYGLQK